MSAQALKKTLSRSSLSQEVGDEVGDPVIPTGAGRTKYKLMEEIGSGGYSTVHKARERTSRFPFRRTAGPDVCIKVCNVVRAGVTTKETDRSDPCEEQQQPTQFSTLEILEREVGYLRSLQGCIHIVQLYEAFELPSGREVWMVMELAKGTLADIVWMRLLKSPENMNPDPTITVDVSSTARKAILYQVLQALAYLKSKRIIHKDLKPDNVLLTSVGTAKLCDFGLSASVLEGQDDVVVQDKRGTPEYMAPEYWCEQKRLDYGTDIWSFGLIIYSTYTRGKTPFTNPKFFLPAYWDEYREGNNDYYFRLLGGSAVDLGWVYSVRGVKRSSLYEKERNSDLKFLESFIAEVKRCIVPYADRGPGEPIERTDVLQRARVEELLESSFFAYKGELYGRQCVMQVVNSYCALLAAEKEEEVPPSL